MKDALIRFSATLVIFTLGLAGCGGNAGTPVWQPSSTIPISGPEQTSNTQVDTRMMDLAKKYNIPGESLAITHNGKLIFARAYGYADLEGQQPMQPDSRGRIGSISKTVTAMALLHLVEEGKLNLDTPFLDILTQYTLPSNADPRLRSVTVRQVMWHTGGWDTSVSGDVEMMSPQIAKELGVPEPTNCGDWIRYKLGKPLDFTPGSKYSYSNFGYCVLSRIVEKASGENYYDYVKEEVLTPMNIHRMDTAYTLLNQRRDGEVKYYDYPGANPVSSVFPPHSPTAAPYGWAQMEALEGMGGWLASSVDLARFLNSVDGSRAPQYLSPAGMDQFLARPQIPGADGANDWYGLGVGVVQTPSGLYWNHNGGCPGTIAIITHRPDGYDYAFVMNTRPHDQTGFLNEAIQAIDGLINAGITESSTDLFSQFSATN